MDDSAEPFGHRKIWNGIAVHGPRFRFAYTVVRASHHSVKASEVVGEWMKQVGRNLTDCSEEFLSGCRYLIHDRSALLTKEFQGILKSGGVKSPNLNAFAERFLRSIKSECLDRMILIGKPSLRRAVDQFAEHYHRERNHQGLENNIIEPEFGSVGKGSVNCRERLGGLLRYYDRDVA